MKIFGLLRHHKASLILALALLLIQANCDLSLPTLMSDIVDTGVSNGGIESVVPSHITTSDLKDLELFLSSDETDQVESAFSKANDQGVRTFTGTSEVRDDISGFLGSAEMLVYQLSEGVPAKDLSSMMSTEKSNQGSDATTSSDAHSQQSADQSAQADASASVQQASQASVAQVGAQDDTVDLSDIRKLVDAGILPQKSLVQARQSLAEELGDNGDSIIKARAVSFVKEAYTNAGIDLNQVQRDYLLREGSIMLAYALVGALCAVAAAANAARTAAKVARDLRHDLYERVLSFSPHEMSQFSAASLITRGTNDIQQIQTVLVMCMRIVLYAPVMGLGAIVRVIGYGDTGLQWIIVVAVVGIAAVIGVLMGLTMPKFRRMQELVDRNNLVAREILTGIMPIRAFGRARFEEQRYDEANRDLTRTYIFTNRAMTFMMPAMLVTMNLTSVAIVWFGGHGIDAGTMQVGDLMAYMNYTIQVIMSFMIITMISVMLPRADVAAERVCEVLATHSSIVDPVAQGKDGEHPTDAAGAVLPWRGELTFNDVSFSYPGAEAPTIEHVSFTAHPGETVGIIGSTGVGKSTLVQLIPRLFDVTEGSVTVDGVDVRSIGLKELRSLIGYVPQKGMLFSGTIEDNIKYGDPEMDDQYMERAAQTAQAREFINAKDEGFASPISQGGSNVSGGQRQRLAIARALAIRPRIMVFDDSFSALDYKTDATLREALAQQAADATLVIVAQRIATIMHAAQILVLDDGRVVGHGTHEELLRTCPAYLEIASSQLSASELGLTEDEIAALTAQAQEGGAC